MPYDLPATALSPFESSSWAKALNYRDFQDKSLRVIQYGSRGAAYWILQACPESQLGLKLFRLYKGLSLSRKAFRCCRSLADLHKMHSHLATWLQQPSKLTGLLASVQWAFMAGHIFWDNMFFCTHPLVGLIDRPDCPRWSNDATNLHQKNWRAVSDTMGLVNAVIKYSKAGAVSSARWQQQQGEQQQQQKQQQQQQQQQQEGVEKAQLAKREAFYEMLKLFADVCTYFPQATWMMWTMWSSQNGWHDGYIGICGIVAALCSCRSEWIKMGNKQ